VSEKILRAIWNGEYKNSRNVLIQDSEYLWLSGANFEYGELQRVLNCDEVNGMILNGIPSDCFEWFNSPTSFWVKLNKNPMVFLDRKYRLRKPEPEPEPEQEEEKEEVRICTVAEELEKVLVEFPHTSKSYMQRADEILYKFGCNCDVEIQILKDRCIEVEERNMTLYRKLEQYRSRDEFKEKKYKCPFCGSNDNFVTKEWGGRKLDGFFIACRNCRATGPEEKTEAKANSWFKK